MKIRCGWVLDLVTGEGKKDKDITVKDGKIDEISNVEGVVGQGDVDLSELYILPGFVDAHNHLCFDVGDEIQQIGEHLGYQALVGAKNARAALLSGVTTVRDAGERGYVDFAVKRGINEGLIPGPRLLAAGPGIMRTGGHMWYMGEESDGEAEVRKTARRQLKAGVDFVKIFVSGGATSHLTGTVTPEMTKEEIETMIYEAHTAGKKIGAHTHGGEAATWAIEAGVDAVELGISLAVGNDTNHGCIAEEIAFLERAGMERRAALLAATLGGASLCGIEEEIGTLDIGKEADLIAFERDPLTAAPRELVPAWVIRSGKVMKNPVGVCS